MTSREAFEAWLGIKPCGAAHDLSWKAWQAATDRARDVAVKTCEERAKVAWNHSAGILDCAAAIKEALK